MAVTTALALLAFALAGIAGGWPALPASVLLVGFVWLPGAVAVDALLSGRAVSRDAAAFHAALGPGRPALACACSLVLLMPAVLPLFLMGGDLALARYTLPALYAPLAIAFLVRGRSFEPATAPAALWVAAAAAIAVLLPVVHVYAGGSIDDWWDLAFVHAYVDRNPLSFAEPVLGTGRVHPRFAWNAWLVLQSLVAEFAAEGTAGATLQAGALPLLVCVFTVSGATLLAVALFGDPRRRAVIACILVIPLWLYGTEALPFFTRLHQDKFVAALVLMPALLAAAIACLRATSWEPFVLLLVAATALGSVHAVVYAIGLIGVLACMAAELSPRSETRASRALAVAACAALPLLYPAWQSLAITEWFGAQGITLSSPDNPVVRAHLRLGRLLGAESAARIVNPAAVFGPVALVALLGVVAAWRARREVVGRRLLWLTALPCSLTFVPYVAGAFGAVLVPWMLYRVAWLVPVPLLIGFAIERAGACSPRPLRAGALTALAATLTVALCVPVAADRLRRDMAEHPTLRARHPVGTTLAVYEFLAGRPEAGPVLAPQGLSRLIPALGRRAVVATSERGTLVFAGGDAAAYTRLRDRATFFAAGTDVADREAIARRYDAAFAVFRRRMVTSGSEAAWFERASAEGFAHAYEREGAKTWSAESSALTRSLPSGWPVVFENADYFVVRTARLADDPPGEQAPDVDEGWLAPFRVHQPDLSSGGVVLASAVGFPGAQVTLSPVPIGLGISDRLVWTSAAALWDDPPYEVTVELDLRARCEVNAVEVVPFLSSNARQVFEVVVGDTRRRLLAEDGRSLFVSLPRRSRERVTVHVRSLLGSSFGLAEVRLWGDGASCEGEPALVRGRLDEPTVTAGELSSLVMRYPRTPRAWLGLARRASEEDRDGDAMALLRGALGSVDGAAAPLIELGLLRDADGRFQEALDTYRRALAVDSNSAWARGCMAWAELRRGRTVASLYHAQRAVRLDPGYADGYTILAQVAARLRASSRAQALLDHATRLDPRRSWPYLVRARMLVAAGRETDAAALLREYLSRVPDDDDALAAAAALRDRAAPKG